MELNKIYNVDNRIGLKNLPDESVNCCVTSPPYFGLRDYGHEGQIGLEDTPEAFVAQMVDVFTEVKRVLKKDGTLWLNLGDSYNGYPANVTRGGKISGTNQHARAFKESGYGLSDKSLKPKDLIGIPWMVAFALRSAGWYLRQDIIWHKPNPMPESVTDRCTKAHEYIFLLSKSAKYYYDYESIKVEGLNPADDIRRLNQQKENNKSHPTELRNGIRKRPTEAQEKAFLGNVPTNLYRCGESADGKANKRSVWTVTTKPFSDAHFATFPEDLIVDCIKAGCPEGGIVLDPFMGAGTTALVSAKLNRNYVGFELNPDYIKIAERRLHNELGMFHPALSETA